MKRPTGMNRRRAPLISMILWFSSPLIGHTTVISAAK